MSYCFSPDDPVGACPQPGRNSGIDRMMHTSQGTRFMELSSFAGRTISPPPSAGPREVGAIVGWVERSDDPPLHLTPTPTLPPQGGGSTSVGRRCARPTLRLLARFFSGL